MTATPPAHVTGSADFAGAWTAGGVLRAAKWLRMAAAPTFAIMALMTGLDGGTMDRLCSSGHAASFSGMVTMYLLMSVFHVQPWLGLICSPAPRTASR